MSNYSIWSNYLGKAQHSMAMEQNLGLLDEIVKIPKKKTDSAIKSHKCNQCNYASSQSSNLKTHFKRHSGEKLHKCKQCNYASSYAGTLRTHMTTHSGERPNKCNQCEYASSQLGHLRTHLKTHSGEKSNKCNYVTLPLLRENIWGHILECKAEKAKSTLDHKNIQNIFTI